ncbi:MAG: DUF2779 domain-containing protein [Spirochaetota bacterium]
MSESELRVTASDYLLYRRCPRSLHLRLSGEALPSGIEADRLYPVASERSRVRELARLRFPRGVEGGPLDGAPYQPAAPESDGPAPGAAPLFDARCYYAPFEAAADVWYPAKPDGMAALLVREGTSVKEAYLREAAFLDYCFAGCGERPRRILLLHVNKNYERGSELDLDELFVERDLSGRVRKMRREMEAELESLRSELEEDPTLARYRSTLCERPRSCPVCSRDVPEVDVDHVSSLHRGGSLIAELLEEGITTIPEVSVERLHHARQEIQRRTLIERRPHVDTAELRAFLDRLSYPVCYLDFEATSTAIPPFEGVKPWEHIPYLYSLHREYADGSLDHRAFMSDPGVDGRIEMLDRLLADAGPCGSLVVYSAGFERGILQRLARLVPERANDVERLIARIVDLLEPFHEFRYYHHEQRGKVSLKTVLPVLTTRDYSGQAVQDGYTANRAYRYLAEAAAVDPESRAKVLSDLTSYCAMDTMAMVHIVGELRRVSG